MEAMMPKVDGVWLVAIKPLTWLGIKLMVDIYRINVSVKSRTQLWC